MCADIICLRAMSYHGYFSSHNWLVSGGNFIFLSLLTSFETEVYCAMW